MTNTVDVTLSPLAAGPVAPAASGYSSELHTFPAYSGAAQAITAWKRRESANPSDNKAFVWVEHNTFSDRAVSSAARPPENVMRYDQLYRYGNTPGWVNCWEVRNPGGCETQPLYISEGDCCSDGDDPNDLFIGHAIYYGAQTNTFGPGPQTTWGTAYRVHPFVYGRNAIRRGFSVEGKVTIGALTVGEHGESEIRHAVNMGPGVTLRWASGEGKAHAAAWHSLPREFSVEEFPVVGLLDIEVDGTTLQIPVFRKTV